MAPIGLTALLLVLNADPLPPPAPVPLPSPKAEELTRSERGLRGHLLAAIGASALRVTTNTVGANFGLSLALVGGATYHLNRSWGLLAEAGVDGALGSGGAHSVMAGVGASIAGEVRIRFALCPAYAFGPNVSALGFGVLMDLVRPLSGGITIGFSTAYLQYTAAPGFQQQLRLGLSLGYGI
jgi:hypothetical protein